MRTIIALLFCFTGLLVQAQTQINMPSGDNGGSGFLFVGCGGQTFNDSAGSLNYPTNENNLAVFCPVIPTDRMQLNFVVMDIGAGDFLTIYDGDSTAAPVLATATGTTTPLGLIQASPTNSTGCLTVRFTSNASGSNAGWRAARGCFDPCQSISTNITTTPATDADGILRVCKDEQITLNGSATFGTDGTGATYEWDLADGNGLVAGANQSISYPNAGVYQLQFIVTDSEGCIDREQIDLVIQVSTDPDFTGTMAADSNICFGETTTLTGVVTPQEFAISPSPPITGQTFLPDGSGVAYQTCIDVDLFPPGSVVNSASDIVDFFLNMEHSYLGDLEVTVTAPNGSQVALHQYSNGGGTFLGVPIDNDSDLSPGTGFDYVFTETATQTWAQAASGFGGTLAAGDYLPAEPYSNFVGSPLNGLWCINVVDNLNSDNGYIFYWGINFNPSIIPGELSFTPGVTSEMWLNSPDIIATNANEITVMPSAEGQNCYTYEFVDSFGCTYVEQVCIDVASEILDAAPDDIVVCTAGTVDLTQNDVVVLNGLDPANYVVSYHLSLSDAENAANPINNASTYTPTSNPQTLFATITELSSSCLTVDPAGFLVEIVDFGQFTIPDIQSCPALVNFDLINYVVSNLMGGSGGAGSGYTISLHPTQADAQAGTNALPTPYSQASGTQTVYIRIESDSDATCNTILPFDIVVIGGPTAMAPASMIQCDDVSNDGVEVFDFSTQEAQIVGTQNPATYNISYHSSQADADSNASPLSGTSYTNTASNETIFVRVESSSDPSCYSTTSFDIVLSRQAEVAAVNDLEVCDDLSNDGFAQFDLTSLNAAVLGTQIAADNTIGFYTNQADATAGTNAIANPSTYTNTTQGGETIYVRIENNDNTTCASTDSFELIINQQPVANPVADEIVCDDSSNDGIAVFDLNSFTTEVLGAQDPLQFNVSYHNSLADAQSGAAPITGLANFSNTTSPQTIWVRVENSANMGCEVTTSFDLIVNRLAEVVAVNDLEVCDDLSNDGFAQFDLTSLNAAVLGTQVAADNTIGFYTNQADATAGTNAIANPSTYTNTTQGGETIYVRIENNDNTTCASTDSFELIINQQPVANPVADEIVCDDSSNDGIAVFDLNSFTTEVLGAQDPLQFNVSYHNSLADAQSGAAPITGLANFSNTTSPQTIWVRVENSANMGCEVTTSFDLIVNRLAEVAAVNDLEVCDDLSNDGFAQFDLTSLNAAVLGTQVAADNTIGFYTNQADATAGTNAIANPSAYTNSTVGGETIYVRIENNDNTTCASTDSFELIINQQPVANPVADEIVCDDSSNDGIAVFDLNSFTTEVLGAQDPLQFNVSYHNSLADAQSGAAPITGLANFSNTTSPQTIWVRVENSANMGCEVTTSFDLIVNPVPDIVAPPAIAQCDDPSGDGVGIFDLTENEVTMLNGLDPNDYSITYTDASGSVISAPYTSSTSPETISVTVTDNTTACQSTVDFDLILNPVPDASSTTTLEECDVNNTGTAVFNLSEANTSLINGQMGASVSYYATAADADADISSLAPNAYQNTSDPQPLYYRISFDATGCYSIGSLTLEVADAPIAIMPTPLEACDSGNGTATVDLSLRIDQITAGQMGTTVEFYRTQADADASTGAVALNFDYTADTMLVARVEDDSAGCVSFTNLEVIYNELPTPSLLPEYVICKDENGNLVNGPETLDTGLTSSGYSFEWTRDGVALSDVTASIQVADAGDYQVLVTDLITGCENTATTNVRIAGVPDIFNVDVTTDPFDKTHQVIATAEGPDEYWFRLDDGPYVNSGVFNDVSPGPHSVTIAERSGCGELVVEIFVFGYPDYFTPNADGIHDTWNIIGGDQLPGTQLYIFDRYGKLIKQLDASGAGWDGTYNGQPLPSTDYWFKIEYAFDGQQREATGHFAMKR